MTAPRKPRKAPTAPEGTAVGYLRVSTEEQTVSGLGLEAQRVAIEAKAKAMGLTVTEWHSDEGVSGKVAPLDRPQLRAVLDAMSAGRAERVIVAKLDRLGRDAARVLDLDTLAAAEGWGITMCDFDLDTSTATGRFMLNNLAGAAEFERRLIGERTKAALAVKKSQGVRLGRPSQLALDVVRRIVAERKDGKGLRVIAEGLTADGIPTARGGLKWSTSTVQAVLKGQDAARLTSDS